MEPLKGYFQQLYLDFEVDDLMRDLPADAKHSVFKDNVNWVKQFNIDVLMVLNVKR